MKLWTAGVGMLSVLMLTAGCGRTPEPPWKTDSHFVMNHRSGRVFAPTETVPAILYSVRAGADSIDLDLRKTADGVLVCFHDSWVMTRECFGSVGDLSWEVLSRADVGYEFDEDVAGTRVLTFEEVVRFCAASGIRFHIESKVGDAIAPEVVSIIERHGAWALVTDMQRLPAPERADWKPVEFHAHTMGDGGDDDRWDLRRRITRSRRESFHVSVEDCRAFADVLDRHGERRWPGEFTLDPVPLVPKSGWPADELLSALVGPDERKALDATIKLVWQRERPALPVLREHAARHPSTKVRAGALWALGRMNDALSFDLLATTALSSPERDRVIPYVAMFALSDLDTPEAAGVLERVVKRGLGGQTADALDENGRYCEDALLVLGRMKTPEAVDVLGFALRSRPANRYLTQPAASSLARIGGPRAIEHLVACLDEERPAHRREIIWALVRLQPDSVQPVLRELRVAKTSAVRVNCLRVLGWCEKGMESPPPAVLECLDSTVPEVRGEAAWVCGRRGFREAVGPLKKLLTDADENVRLDAQQALRRLGIVAPEAP